MEAAFFFEGYPLLYSKEALNRIVSSRLDFQLSLCFSFYIVMYNGFHIYLLVAHLLITIPFLRFFDERRQGYTKLLGVRKGSSWYIQEAVADSLTAGFYVLVPLLIFCGAAALLCPM